MRMSRYRQQQQQKKERKKDGIWMSANKPEIMVKGRQALERKNRRGGHE